MKIAYGKLLTLSLCALLLASCSATNFTSDLFYTEPKYIEAQEFKLKIRELGDQLLATVPNRHLVGYIAFPTAFVNINNLQETSPLGRLIGESLIYEFNQRGFPVREYRLPGYIAVEAEAGTFALDRSGLIKANERWTALIIGTYYTDDTSVFINARLVRAVDGMVFRTAQLVLANNEFLSTALPPVPPYNYKDKGTMKIGQSTSSR